MRRNFRVIGLLMILAAVAIAVRSGLGAGRRSAASAEILSPPDGLTVPAGQAVEVRYRVAGPVGRAGAMGRAAVRLIVAPGRPRPDPPARRRPPAPARAGP
ncbi:MAG: hypothetical protein ACP5UQ_14445 [Anaerolineae bacterium]